jgi:predicted RNase H-like HicB family nuclease
MHLSAVVCGVGLPLPAVRYPQSGTAILVGLADKLRYKVVLYRSDEGVAVGCPALPGCWSQGADESEALENIVNAIEEYLASIDDELQSGGEVREVEVAV